MRPAAACRAAAAAAMLGALLPACVPRGALEGSLSEPIGALWSRTHARLDSLGSIDDLEPAMRTLRDAGSRSEAPEWLLADVGTTESAWRDRMAAPLPARAALSAADRASRRAAAMVEHDSLAQATAQAALALAVRDSLLGRAHPATLRAAILQANIAFRLGRAAEADSLAARVLEQLAPGARAAHPLAAAAEQLRGRVAKNFEGSRSRARAMGHYERALAIQSRAYGERSLEVAAVHHEMGNLERMVQRPREAIAHFERALSIRRERLGARHEDVASTLSALAFLSAGQGNWREAAERIRAALAAAPDSLPPATASTRHGLLGRALRRLGRAADAVPPLERAAAAAETTWARSGRDAGSTLQSGLSIHGELAMALAALGRGEEAFLQMERAQARGWAESSGEADPWRDLPARVQRACPEDAAVVGWTRLTVAPPGGDFPAWAYVVRSRGGVQWVRIDRLAARPATRPPIRNALLEEVLRASQWPLRIEATQVVDSLAALMHRQWFAPIEPHLSGVRRLIVVGPDLMASAPLALARDGEGRWLGERFIVQYAPSALAFATLAERAAPAPRGPLRAVLVGAPAAAAADSGRFAPLVGAAGELAALARLFPEATVLSGAAATAARLRALARGGALARDGVLHVAAHTEIDADRVMRSSLVLAPEPGSATSSRLMASEIASDWRMRPRLVSLAGCRTMLGVNSATEGWLGLQSAFLSAGARSVLVSLWQVEDEATARLMTEFYSRLTDASAGVDAAEALQQAQQAVRRWRSPDGRTPYAHPVYWAGFALVGV